MSIDHIDQIKRLKGCQCTNCFPILVYDYPAPRKTTNFRSRFSIISKLTQN